MRFIVIAVGLVAGSVAAQGASGRYACKAGSHDITLDFGRKVVTLDGASDAMTQGVATWRGKPGGKTVILIPPEKAATRIFDISIDGGTDYSGFVVCRAL